MMVKHPCRTVEAFSLFFFFLFVFYLPNVTKQAAARSPNRTSALLSLRIKNRKDKNTNSSPHCTKAISGTALGHLMLRL